MSANELLFSAVMASLSALFNAAVIWGVLKTQLAQLRRDVDMAHRRLDAHGAPSVWAISDN